MYYINIMDYFKLCGACTMGWHLNFLFYLSDLRILISYFYFAPYESLATIYYFNISSHRSHLTADYNNFIIPILTFILSLLECKKSGLPKVNQAAVTIAGYISTIYIFNLLFFWPLLAFCFQSHILPFCEFL